MAIAKVIISNRQKEIKIPSGIRLLMRRCCEATLQTEGFTEQGEISISFVSNEEIRKINAEFRNVDAVTDVISFPLGEDGIYDRNPESGALLLGDIVISTFYDVDASNLGPHFTYASYDSETLGLIYFPVCYVVIPTESNVITDIVLERNYTTLLREDMTKEQVFMAIYVREYYVYAMKVNETDEHYYYFRTDRVDVKGYGIDNIVKYEIKDGYLYVTINHKGRIVEDKFNLQY